MKDDYHKTHFDEHRSKINSIAVIHELIYKSKNLTQINLKNYINEISFNLQEVYQSDARRIEISTNIEEVVIELDIALPLGLIVNEVITNSFKHAFKGKTPGKISISLKKIFDKIQLQISDNGKSTILEDRHEGSIGMDILEGPVEQINAKHSFKNTEGTIFLL